MNIKTGNVASFDTRYVKISQPDMNLILDAPKLLAEFKRLREGIKLIAENTHENMRIKYNALMELIE